MFIAVARSVCSFFLPGGLLFLSAVLFFFIDPISVWPVRIVTIYPALVAVLAVLFGWRFNKSRLIFAVLVLGLADRFLLDCRTWPAAEQDAAFLLISILAPLNLAVIALLRERGILSLAGIFRLAAILSQPILLGFLYQKGVGELTRLDCKFIQWPPLDFLNISQASLATFLLCLIIVTASYIKTRGALENGFIWALVSVFFGLAVAPAGHLSTLSFATAGLVLFLSAVESVYFAAFRDELTGLPSRRALNEYFLKIHGRYCVAMLDIDFFKKFNDRFGHNVGDQVLCMVAARIAGVKGGGRAFRYGGEEFTVVFPGKNLAEVQPHLEDLRAAIEASGFTLRREKRTAKNKGVKAKGSVRKVGVTVSIGVAERSSAAPQSDQVIRAADKALYRAKKKGRNLVVSG